jgi:hypothetical protein
MSRQRRLDKLCSNQGRVQWLVTYMQTAEGLDADGDWGPATEARYQQLLTAGEVPSTWGLAALEVALGEIGKGEVGADNAGPVVAMYQGVDPGDDGSNLGSWCAGFVGWCIEQAAAQIGTLTVPRISWARSLMSRIRRRGRAVTVPVAGDIVLFERGDPGGSSHIGIVERVEGNSLHTVEGNTGRPPALVRRRHHRLDSDRIIGFARLP